MEMAVEDSSEMRVRSIIWCQRHFNYTETESLRTFAIAYTVRTCSHSDESRNPYAYYEAVVSLYVFEQKFAYACFRQPAVKILGVVPNYHVE